MSAPVAVNTADGTCWTRRGATRGGEALYAPEGVCSCPEFVMATLAELAEHGIVGSADALPMPVGPARQDGSNHAKVAELIGDAKPASDGLLLQLGESVRDRREHEHPKWEDLFCLNLVSFMGERMGPVLRRLLDAEARVAELEALTASATEFRVWEPGYGLYVRRAPGTIGFAVMEARRTDKGRRVWTAAGWQYSAILSDAEMFCWPDAQTAVGEAQRIMPGAVGDEGLSGPCDCGEGAIHYTDADCPAQRSAAKDVTPQVQKLRAILAGQREQTATDAPHEGPQHHTYRLGRDLPETGGAPC